MRLGDHNERQLNAAAEVIAQKNKELESLSTKLSKYLSPQIYNSIFTGAQGVEIASNRKKLTIFFSDVVNFTETTEKLEVGGPYQPLEPLPHRDVGYRSSAWRHHRQIYRRCDHGVLRRPRVAGAEGGRAGLRAMAIAMLRRMHELRSEWQELGAEKPFRVRMGINTGYCTVGNFGSQDRMDYTIIGNAVNLTARLQSNSEIDGILLGHETYSLVKDEVSAEEQTPIKVKGFAEPVRCYKVVGLYDHLAEAGTVIREEHEGFKFHLNLQKRDKAEAISILEGILSRLKA